ncbi:MAG: hypothetical protein IJB98_03245 [Clostridia bacterium]|nr:hypothetical protein [Clostridia bacterium]
MVYGWLKLWFDFLDTILGSQYQEEKKEYEGLPYGCWHCEVLGMCRRPKEQGWKCYNGCIKINMKREEEEEKEAIKRKIKEVMKIK